MSKIRTCFIAILCVVFLSCGSLHPALTKDKNLSPYDYGLSHARNGEDRYRILYETHLAAIAAGVDVDYSGIRSIDLEIPRDAKSIPLTTQNDFSGVNFNVVNKTDKNIFLFTFRGKSVPIEVSKDDIDRGSFKHYPILAQGKHLLVITDDSPWVEKREGYSYGHERKDILLIEKGCVINKTVMPYNNSYSLPSCQYYDLQVDSVIIANVTLNRSNASESKVYLCAVNGIDNITLRNVEIHTPANDWTSDVAISIKDCSNVKFDGVKIDGTYSRTNHSGYGVYMDNIWNFQVHNMTAQANWGVFGTNNVNVAHFEDSDINRFDIHCYGRDISFDNVVFRDKYNQFASVFGTISFNNCTFIDFVPIVNGPSYNAYVGYDVIMNDCVLKKQRGVTMLIDEGYIDNRVNKRRELSDRCLPNVTINNLTLLLGNQVQEVILFYFRQRGLSMQQIKYLTNITINGLNIKYEDGARTPINLEITNVPIRAITPVHQIMNNIDIIGNSTRINKNKGRFINRLETTSNKSTVQTSSIKATSVE